MHVVVGIGNGRACGGNLDGIANMTIAGDAESAVVRADRMLLLVMGVERLDGCHGLGDAEV